MEGEPKLQRAKEGLEWLVRLVIFGGGVALAIRGVAWLMTALGALLVAILLNAFLVVLGAIRVGRADRIPVALAGSLFAAPLDAVKLFVIADIGRLLGWSGG